MKLFVCARGKHGFSLMPSTSVYLASHCDRGHTVLLSRLRVVTRRPGLSTRFDKRLNQYEMKVEP
jgi:hypothetical protein